MQEKNGNYKVTNLVGVPTNYSDENNWAYLPENTDKAVDTFFIYPTLYINPEPDAPASENIGDRLIIMEPGNFEISDMQVNKPGLADAQLDLERGVVVCTTLADYYVKIEDRGVDSIFGPESLHECDYAAYWDNIRENVMTRIDAFLNK